MVGKFTDVTSFTREEAIIWVKHHCGDCEIRYNCNGSDSAICNDKVKYLTEKYRNADASKVDV